MSSIVSKVLCERHNNMLSDLDVEAAKFFKALLCLINPRIEINNFRKVDDYNIFSGEDIEKWCIKLILGSVSSNMLPAFNKEKMDTSRVGIFADFLFANKPLPDKWGLYSYKGDISENIEGLSFDIMNNENNLNNFGAIIKFTGLCYFLSFGIKHPKMNVYHPNTHIFSYNNIQKKVVLTWKNEKPNYISYSHNKQPQ